MSSHLRSWIKEIGKKLQISEVRRRCRQLALAANRRPTTKLLLETLEDRITPSAYSVLNNNPDPTVAGSLGKAITDAVVANDTAAIITFDPSLAGATISLTSALRNTAADNYGQTAFYINGSAGTNLTIDGTGLSSPVTISGGAVVRIFLVASGNTLTLQNNLTLTNGRALGTQPGAVQMGSGGGGAGLGGAVFNNGGTVSASSVTFNTNTATGGKGGSYTGSNFFARGGGSMDSTSAGANGAGTNGANGGGIGGSAGTATAGSIAGSGGAGGFGGGGGGGGYSTSNTGFAQAGTGGNGGFGGGGGGTGDGDNLTVDGFGGIAGRTGAATDPGAGGAYAGSGGVRAKFVVNGANIASGGDGGGGAGLGGAIFSYLGTLTLGSGNTFSGNTATGGLSGKTVGASGTALIDGQVAATAGQGLGADVFSYYDTTSGVVASGTVKIAAPEVQALSRSSGTTGVTVIVRGVGFSGTTGAGGVKFGANNATSYTVDSDFQITATAPAGASGTVDVTVTAPAGTTAISAVDQFTYAAPTITYGLSANTGAAGGGNTVTIYGTNFSGATGVNFGANAATGVTVVSNLQITCTVPAGTGTVDVRVINPNGTSAVVPFDQYAYSVPTGLIVYEPFNYFVPINTQLVDPVLGATPLGELIDGHGPARDGSNTSLGLSGGYYNMSNTAEYIVPAGTLGTTSAGGGTLTYPGAPPAAITPLGNMYRLAAANIGDMINLSRSFGDADGATSYWVSVLISPSTAGAFSPMGWTFRNSAGVGFSLGSDGGTWGAVATGNAAFLPWSSTALSGGTVTVGTPVHLVAKITFSGNGSTDMVEAYTNPGFGASPATGVTNTLTGYNLGDIVMMGAKAGRQFWADEVRIADSFANLWTDPTTLGVTATTSVAASDTRFSGIRVKALNDAAQNNNQTSATATRLAISEGNSNAGLFQFDASPATAATYIPAGHTITSAKVVLTSNYPSLTSGDRTPLIATSAYEITSAWSEGATPNPTIGSLVATGTGIQANGHYSYDITALATAWFSGATTNNGIAVKQDTTQGQFQIYSRQAGTASSGYNVLYSSRPILVITTALTSAADFGDAPTAAQSGFTGTYPTLLANNGARHEATGPTLGATRDTEADGQPNAAATGDGADEDGVIIPSLAVGTSQPIVVNASATGVLNGWIDWNRDGDWTDPGEQIALNVNVVAGSNNLVINVPSDASAGTSFSRFRLSTAAGDQVTGYSADGEVEDYQVTITSGAVAPAMISFVINGNIPALAGPQRSMVNSFVVTFNQPVTLDPGAFVIALPPNVSVNFGPYTSTVGTIPTLSWSSTDGGTTWIITFSGAGVVGGSIDTGVYEVTTLASKVHVGAIYMADNCVGCMYRLYGDTNGDKEVGGVDLAAFTAAFGAIDGVDANYNPALDANSDGEIGGFDLAAFTAAFGVSYETIQPCCW